MVSLLRIVKEFHSAEELDNVDRNYAKAAAKSDQAAKDEPPEPTPLDVVSSSAPVDEPYSFQRHIQVQPDYERLQPLTTTTSISTRPSPLTSLFQSLPIPPESTTFLPADENLPLPISRLPAELFEKIFHHLHVSSLEQFGSTCWRARYLTAFAGKWKRLAEGIYRPPAMVGDDYAVGELGHRYKGEWRTAVVEEERVRMDGCYIAVCHYVRPGAGDEWVTVNLI